MAFLQNITLGRYVALDSPVHRLDPRTKLIASLSLMIVALSARSFVPLLTFAVLQLVAIALTRLSYRLVLGTLKPFIWLFTFTFGLHALLTPGRAVFLLPLSEHAVTAEGLHLGAFFAVRLAAVIVAASLLTLTTSPMQLTGGLERLFRPLQRFGFPAGDLAMMISIALRFIPVLVDEAERENEGEGRSHSTNPSTVRSSPRTDHSLLLASRLLSSSIRLGGVPRAIRGQDGSTCGGRACQRL